MHVMGAKHHLKVHPEAICLKPQSKVGFRGLASNRPDRSGASSSETWQRARYGSKTSSRGAHGGDLLENVVERRFSHPLDPCGDESPARAPGSAERGPPVPRPDTGSANFDLSARVAPTS